MLLSKTITIDVFFRWVSEPTYTDYVLYTGQQKKGYKVILLLF